MANPENLRGGKRKGAGRKLAPKTELARLALAELDEEAEKSVRFLVNVRDNAKISWGIRVLTAQYLIDRRFGKPKQAVALSQEGPIQIQYVPAAKVGDMIATNAVADPGNAGL